MKYKKVYDNTYLIYIQFILDFKCIPIINKFNKIVPYNYSFFFSNFLLKNIDYKYLIDNCIYN